ncbi:7707_t:CDS:2, partial [Acaulospora morrowiae]
YLTTIGLLFSFVAFVFALLYDVFTKSRVISILKTGFMVVTTPLEGLISIMYWGLIAYDEKLLLAPGKSRLPILVDVGFHLIPTICLWIDFLFFTKEFRKSHSHIFYILCFAFSYSVWIQIGFYVYGMWVSIIQGLVCDLHFVYYHADTLPRDIKQALSAFS